MRRALKVIVVAVAITSAAATSFAQTPFVPSLKGPKAIVWAVGDGATGTDEAKAVAARMSTGRIDRFLYLGDVYSHGTALQFQKNYDSVYGALTPITAPTPGNHEWGNRDTGYLPYWHSKRGVPTPYWYAFSVAGWQFLSLNSEEPHDSRSEQAAWLRRKLAHSRRWGNCRIAFWHRPLFSGGPFAEASMRPLWNELRGRARLVLNGHEHNMQRFRPIDGLVEIISGAGAVPAPNPIEGHPQLAFANTTVTGALRLVLTRGQAKYRAIATDGTVLDAGRVRCTPGKKPRGPKK